MDYRSVGDLTGVQADKGQSYVTVIPVEYARRMPAGHGYLEDRYSREYMRDRLPPEYLVREYKKVSRYEEMRYYGGGGGGGGPPLSTPRQPPPLASYELGGGGGGGGGRRRFEQLDPRVQCYPLSSTLGRRKPEHKVRDPLDVHDVQLSHYKASHPHHASTLHHGSGHHAARAAQHPLQQHLGQHGGQQQHMGPPHSQQQHLGPPHSQQQLLGPPHSSQQQHLSQTHSAQQLHSTQQLDPRSGQQHPSQQHASQQHQMQQLPGQQHPSQHPSQHQNQHPSQHPSQQHVQPGARYDPLKHQRVYDKGLYADMMKEKHDKTLYNERMRETHSESSVLGLHAHGRRTPPSFPPPPPPVSVPPPLPPTQILPPPAGYQNQPAKRPPSPAPPSLAAQQAGPIPGKARAPTPNRRKKKAAPLEVCVYLMSQQAVRLQADDGAELTAAQLQQCVMEEEDLGLSPLASQVFGIWMTSSHLEIQLKPHHKPFHIRREWRTLLGKYSSADEDEILKDEPIVSFQRSVFFSKKDEMKIRDPRILELLFEEAKFNILEGRYPCEASDYDMLAGLQARLELGAFDADIHTPDFFRSHITEYLPDHVISHSWSLISKIGGKASAEARIIEQFRSIPSGATRRKLVRKYLEFCWSLPYYGSAFFCGQVEQPARSMLSVFYRPDVPVLVSINGHGVYVIDKAARTVLLGLSYDELAWDFARPCQESIRDCMPCIFLQFQTVEYGMRVSKVLQVFSKQSALMDALISSCVEEIKRRTLRYGDEIDASLFDSADVDDALVPLTTVTRREMPDSCLSNKLHRLTLATFNEDGECIKKMGSWSFSK